MKIEFYKKNGEKDVAQEYPKILESEISDSRILEYVRYIRATLRTSNASTKDRSEVSGGGKKPWKQKGTGRARHGSKRSPIWAGGGVTFGPTNEKNYSLKINKKEKRKALLAAIFSKISEKSALGISDLKFKEPSTKIAAKALENLPLKGKVTLFVPKDDEIMVRSFQNIPIVTLVTASKVDLIAVLSSDNLIFTKESLSELRTQFDPKKVSAEVKAEKVKEETKNE
jgi:large subunit ribosomal protein L4